MLLAEAHALALLNPAFMTVTYGAGGSTRDGTVDTVRAVREKTGIKTAAHLTYINTPITELEDYVRTLWDSGIRHIVALRGDMPADLSWPLDPDADYYQFTSDFVAGLKRVRDFEISVGAYPEKHPDSPSLDADIVALKRKQEAGADRAITQFFFDNDVYFAFAETAQAQDVTIPIVPGLLPIADFEKMLRFADTCQAGVPDWLRDKFAAMPDPDDRLKLAADILTEQVAALAAGGVPHIHFYTLNKAHLTAQAVCNAGLVQDAARQAG